MNKQNERALSDEQLDTISGGCYYPYQPRHCDDYKKDYNKRDYDKCDRDYDRDYDKYNHCGHHRSYCD
jgi:hypothetical protein